MNQALGPWATAVFKCETSKVNKKKTTKNKKQKKTYKREIMRKQIESLNYKFNINTYNNTCKNNQIQNKFKWNETCLYVKETQNVRSSKI